MQFHINVKGLAEAPQKIQDAVFEGFILGLKRAGVRGEILVREMIEHPPFGRPIVATGMMLSGVTHERHGAPPLGKEVIFVQPPGGDYAGYVEGGTGPHFPPPRALLLWVKKKFPEATTEKKALSIAYAVARTIAKRGTLGRGMFHFAFNKLEPELVPIFKRAIAEKLETAGVAP